MLHQGPFGALLRLRSDEHSATARRTTHLFAAPTMPQLASVQTR